MTSKRRKSAKTNKLEAFLCPYKFVQQSNQLAHKMRFQNKKTDALGCELFSNFVPLQCFKYLLIIIDTFGAILLFVLTEMIIYQGNRYIYGRFFSESYLHSGTYFVVIEND